MNRKTIKVLTPAIGLAVSLGDMKDYLRVTTSDDDSMITSFIKASMAFVRNYTRMSLITETLQLTMDGFTEGEDRLLELGAGIHTGSRNYYTGSCNAAELPFSPIQSITSVKTYARDNTETTFSSAGYSYGETSGKLYLNDGYQWPSDLRDTDSVVITYVSGFGDDDSAIPADIAQAIKMHVAQMYECREACGMSTACKDMLASYRRFDNLPF